MMELQKSFHHLRNFGNNHKVQEHDERSNNRLL